MICLLCDVLCGGHALGSLLAGCAWWACADPSMKTPSISLDICKFHCKIFKYNTLTLSNSQLTYIEHFYKGSMVN